MVSASKKTYIFEELSYKTDDFLSGIDSEDIEEDEED